MELVGNIPKSQEYDLNADLYYESSKRLAEEWQWILHFLMTDNKKGLPVLSKENPRAEVHFRIEKVSTSFIHDTDRIQSQTETYNCKKESLETEESHGEKRETS